MKGPSSEKALLLEIVNSPVFVRATEPPPVVVTLLLKVNAFPVRTMAGDPEVATAPLNAASPAIVVSASWPIESTFKAAAVKSLTLPKTRGPIGAVFPTLPLKVVLPEPERKINLCGAWTLLLIVPVTMIFPFPPELSRMMGVRLRGSETREIGLENEMPNRAEMVPAKSTAAERPTPVWV